MEKGQNKPNQYLKRQIRDPRPDPGENRQIRYIPGIFSSRVGDWLYTRGKMDYAGYGMLRPSANGWIK